MNNEKQVVDLKNEELLSLVKQKEGSVSYKLRRLLEEKESKENQIIKIQEELVKTNAKITELEGLTVEDAYALIQEENNVCISTSSGYGLTNSLQMLYRSC